MNHDLSQSISQRSRGEEIAENRRIYEISDELLRRSQLYEAQLRDGQEHVSRNKNGHSCDRVTVFQKSCALKLSNCLLPFPLFLIKKLFKSGQRRSMGLSVIVPLQLSWGGFFPQPSEGTGKESKRGPF